MKVIVGVDGSPHSLDAVQFVARLLRPEQDGIVLYYSTPDVYVNVPESDLQVMDRMRERLSQTVLDEAAEKLGPAWQASVERVVGHEDPRIGLLAAADERGCGMVALGARGLGAVQRFLLGSVSQAVAHATKIPLLIVRRPEHRASDEFRVLLPLAQARACSLVAEVLQPLTWPAESLGMVMTVMESVFGGKLPRWLEEEARATQLEPEARAFILEHERELRETQSAFARSCAEQPWPFKMAPPLVVEGHAADEILAVIASERIDLTVIGTHHPSLMTRWLLGSTSEKVLTHAPCSVLLIPRPLGD